MSSKLICIIGGGPSGIACLERLRDNRRDALLFERDERVGGHCKTHNHQGFYFDEGPHCSFTQDTEVQDYLGHKPDAQILQYSFVVKNYWQGKYLEHPLICHLGSLPVDVRNACLNDFIHKPKPHNENNYKHWCLSSFGKKYSEMFVFPYTRKYWACEPDALDTEWLAPRVFNPSLQQVLDGVKSSSNSNFHYIKQIRYPEQHGFGEFFKAREHTDRIHLKHKVTTIDSQNKTLYFSNGKSANYHTLISSMPLPELINSLKQKPIEVVQASQQLFSSQCELISIATSQPLNMPDCHLMYFLEQDICFSRLHMPHQFSTRNTPAGHFAIQAEVYHSKLKPLMNNNIQQTVVNQILELGFIKNRKDILFTQQQSLPHANIIYTHQRKKNASLILDYLASLDIQCIGRFGLWEYLWSCQSITSGWSAADRLLREPI